MGWSDNLEFKGHVAVLEKVLFTEDKVRRLERWGGGGEQMYGGVGEDENLPGE